ncbi:MAG: GNAT family N-acetyltransferase [Anaerolineaceae bacterium]|nr:GNAT family N-acetyltransferase [Anaerolineaceae bacterium]
MDIIIREAKPRDAAQLLAFVEALAAETDIDVPLEPGEFNLTIEEEEKILKGYAESKNSVFLVAETDGKIIAELTCRGSKPKALRHVAYLGMSVSREWRGQGVGTALMEKLVHWARENGVIKRIELNVYARNKVGIHLYEKFGFVIEGCRRNAIYQGGKYLDDLVMALLI